MGCARAASVCGPAGCGLGGGLCAGLCVWALLCAGFAVWALLCALSGFEPAVFVSRVSCPTLPAIVSDICIECREVSRALSLIEFKNAEFKKLLDFLRFRLGFLMFS